MYEHFNANARKIMQFANLEAQRLDHKYILPEHILLAFVRLNEDLAVDAIKRADGDLRKIKDEVERSLDKAPELLGKLPQTPRSKKLIESAMEEARNLNHNYVGTEHEFLGILLCGQRDCLRALKVSGLDLNVLVHELVSSIETTVDKGLYERQLLDRIYKTNAETD